MKHLTLLLIAAVLYSCAQKEKQQDTVIPELPILQITNGNSTTYQEFPASIEGAVNVEIRPQIDGILERIYVDEGAYVTKGQALFKIEDRPYVEKLNNAIAAQHAANGAVASAQLEVEKLIPLVSNKVVSVYQLKTAQSALNIAKANLSQAKTNVIAARIDVGYTVIKAPVSGYLGRLLIKQGSLVGPGNQISLTQLSDVHEIHAYFSLSEDDFTAFKQMYAGKTLQEKIKQLPPVSLVLSDESSYPLQGKIDMVDGQFDKTTAAITLRAKFLNGDGILRSGNTGKIKLELQHKNVAVVPIDATFELQDKVFVYTVEKNNKVIKQPITVTGKNGTNYLVKEGLNNGDRIVTAGIDHLQDGQAIKPETAKKENKVAYSH